MTLQITLRLSQGSLSLKNFENAYALVNPRTRFLEVYRNRVLIASFKNDNYIGWEYVATPPPQTIATSRAGVLLQSHGV
jgi:hypothetical protein